MNGSNPPQDGHCNILACQLEIAKTPDVPSRDRQVDSVINKISETLQRRCADLVVLPELSTIDYSRATFEQLHELAETLEGRTMNRMQALAQRHQAAILFGMPRYDAGFFYISQIVIGNNGDMLGCFDKLHLCEYGASMEKDFFQRGDHLTVFETAGFRFAPIICYDIRFPELCRTLTLDQQVDCILHCGAYFRDESFPSWHAFATTRAIENQIYLLSLNRAGKDYGRSIFCLPQMGDKDSSLHFSDEKEDFRYLILDHSELSIARQKYSLLEDKLTDYRSL